LGVLLGSLSTAPACATPVTTGALAAITFCPQADRETYCGAEVILSGNTTTPEGNSTSTPIPVAASSTPIDGEEGWFRVSIPLSIWACDRGSVGSLSGVDRVDFQNINIRDADICLDNIALV
jgi:hypothetical protein